MCSYYVVIIYNIVIIPQFCRQSITFLKLRRRTRSQEQGNKNQENNNTQIMDIEVVSVKGPTVKLTSLWSDRRVVICFLRHLGCRFCHQQVASLNEMIPKLNDVTVVAVSMAPSIQAAKEFVEKTKFKGEFYVDLTSETNANVASKETFDRQAKSYSALRLKRGVGYVRDNENVKQKSEEATKAGFNDWKPPSSTSQEVHIWPGDIFQVGGMFVVGPGNFCDYAYRSAFAGDHPLSTDVIRAATGLESDGKDFVYPVTEQWLKKLGSLTPASVSSSLDVNTTRQLGLFSAVLISIPLILSLFTLDPNMFTLQAIDVKIVGSTVLVCMLAIMSSVKPASSSSSSDATSNKKNNEEKVKEVKNPLPKPTLMTPKEIDRKLLEQGMIECDCGAVVSELPFMDVMSADSDESKDESSKTTSTRERSQTWDSALGPNEYQTILCYVKNFLAKAHPAVGRSGPVCPFVPKSLRKDCLYTGVVRFPKDRVITKDHVVDLVRRYASIFDTLEPTKGRARQFKAIVLIFPDIALKDAHEMIDGVQRYVKPDFVSRGLMVGEFHLRNNTSGLRNKKFYPLRTPIPCIAMRHMVPTDLAFLDVDQYEPALRKKFLQSFLEVFGEDKVAKKKPEVKMARAALEKLK